MNRTRFRELDKEAVEVRPPRVDFVPNCLFSVGRVAEKKEDVAEVNMDRDLSEVSVSGRDGFERHNNPQDGLFLGPKHNICQFHRLGEVDRSGGCIFWFRRVFRSSANLMVEAEGWCNLPLTVT